MRPWVMKTLAWPTAAPRHQSEVGVGATARHPHHCKTWAKSRYHTQSIPAHSLQCNRINSPSAQRSRREFIFFPPCLCPSSQCRHCRRPIGSWTWTPTPRQRLYGRLEAPIFRIHKGVVHLADVPLDATPLNTPRPNQDTAPSTTTNGTITDQNNNNGINGAMTTTHGLSSPGVAMMSPSSHHQHTTAAMMSDDDKQHNRWGPSLSSK